MSSENHDAPAPFGPTGWLADDAATDGGGDLTHASRDSDGVPVGRADAEADAERSGADPDTA